MLNESELKLIFKSDQKIQEKSKQISEELINKKYDISTFVEILGFALTSTSVELRVSGTKLLSATLLQLPKDYLTEFQLNFIVTFYCDRLKDHHNVIPPVLDAMLALVQMNNIPNGSITRLLSQFFQQTTCQSQVRSDRLKIFTIFRIIADKFTKELIQMGGDFLYGVINSIDGERDPRNLEFLFNFMPEFIEKFPLLHLAEEMFEIFACYFPIDFNSSKSDPTAITRENLANKLADCLIASNEFIELTVQLALEKLESDLIVAKLDSLDLLARGAKKFPKESFQLYFDKIWLNLKPEIFPGGDNEEVLSAGLKTLRAILESAYANQEISKSYQTTVLGTILTHLSDANHRLFTPARSIALVCVTGDPVFASDKILNTLLLKLESDDCDKNQKTKVLSTVSQVLTICSNKNDLKSLNADLLRNLENDLMIALNEPDASKETIEVLLNCLVEFSEQFKEENRLKIYELLLKILLSDINLERILKRFARNYPNEFQQNLINPLLKKFSDLSDDMRKNVYENLRTLVEVTAFENTILDLILENCFKRDKFALDALKLMLDEQAEESQLICKLYRDYKIVDKIVNLAKTDSEADYNNLEKIVSILNIFVKKLSLQDQKEVLDLYLPSMKVNLATDLFLIKGLLGFMHESINIDDHFEALLTDLTKLSLQTNDEVLRNICHSLLCSLMNKTQPNEKNKTIIRKTLNFLKEEIKKGDAKAVEILSWMSKGLIVRGYEDAGDIIETLAELLNHPTLSKAATLAFEIISIEYPGLHLPIVKFLFKQKFFHIVLNKIEHYLLEYSENHVNAFIYVIKMTPHKVLKLNIDKIAPVLFKCLEINNPTTIQISLEINKVFLQEQNDYFRIHLQHLIQQYLKLTENQETMKIRISALECLEVITKYPTYIILPYKMDVVLSLAPVLDDKKRLVRNAAVRTRNLWYLVGSAN